MNRSSDRFDLAEMRIGDDFGAYESFMAATMRSGDYYSAAELQQLIASDKVSAWWCKEDNRIIGWCGIHWDDAEVWPDAVCFLGVAVAPDHRNNVLALRLIRHILKQAGKRPLTAYIQPGVPTERLLRRLQFEELDRAHPPWVTYLRKNLRDNGL